MMNRIETDYIPLSEAENITGKSRPTLTRLCNRVEGTHARRDTSGAWLIEKAFLQQYYQVQSEKGDEKMKSTVQGEKQWFMQRIEQLEKRLQEVVFSNQVLINENKHLQEENRKLLQAGQHAGERDTAKADRVQLLQIFLIVAFGIVALYLILRYS